MSHKRRFTPKLKNSAIVDFVSKFGSLNELSGDKLIRKQTAALFFDHVNEKQFIYHEVFSYQ